MNWVGWLAIAAAVYGVIRVIAVQPWRAREIPALMSDDAKRAVHERRYPWLNGLAMDHWVFVCLECGKREGWHEKDLALRTAKLHKCVSMVGWK